VAISIWGRHAQKLDRARHDAARHAVAEKTSLVERCGEFLLPRLAEGTLRAVVDRTYPLAEAAAAHRDMEANRNLGKILLVT
jgi:NADPH:quinone reductase-like Zn-dependent oxidoreductase